MNQPPKSPEPRRPKTGGDGSEKRGKDQAPDPMALLGAGTELGGAVAGLSLLGWWLDKRYGTSPWLLLTGAGIGIVGGIYSLWRQGKRYF